jgi:hypothetical protein
MLEKPKPILAWRLRVAKLFQHDHNIASERRFPLSTLYSARIYTTCTAAPYKSDLKLIAGAGDLD